MIAAVPVVAATAISSPAALAATTPQTAPGVVRALVVQAKETRQAQLAHLAHENHLAHLEHLAILKHLALLKEEAVRTVTYHVQAGIYSFTALETLWRAAGGNPAVEVTAACIAEHESGGNPNAISPTDDWGLWQINASHGPAQATLNPYANAVAAVAISADGINWGPWTTAPACGV